MNAEAAVTFDNGDIVWAQMKPWKAWPGRIVKPPKGDKIPESKKNSFYVYFFGSENYGWITRDKIWPYENFKDKYCQNYKRKDFLSGVETADKKYEAKKSGKDSSSNKDEEEDDKEKEEVDEKKEESKDEKDKNKDEKDKNKDEKDKNDGQEEIILEESSSSVECVVCPIASTPSTSAGQTHGKRNASPIKPGKDSPSEPSAKKTRISEINSILKHVGACASRIKTLESCGVFSNLKKHKVGVVGLGTVGTEIATSLLAVRHDVTVWNRTEAKCAKLVAAGARKGESPGEVFKNCDVTLVCVNSAEAVKCLVFMQNGLISTANKKCSLVVLTLMNPEASIDIEEVIVKKNARYLEAPIYRIDEGEPRNLTVLAAGNEGIFTDYESVFKTFAKKCIFLGATGMATKTALVLQSFMGSIVAGMAEAMCVAERTGISQNELLHVISVSPLGSKFLLDKGKAMMEKDFAVRMPLQQVTEAMRDTLNMATKFRHSMPVVAAATEMFVSANALSLGERDMSAVYMPVRY